MTPRYRRILLLCGLLPTLVAAVLSLTRPAALANVEYAVYDRLVRWTPTRQPSGKVVIVDVDEKSLTSVGQWPWRRDVISRLIDSLRDRGAAAPVSQALGGIAGRRSGFFRIQQRSGHERRGRGRLGAAVARVSPPPSFQIQLSNSPRASTHIQTDVIHRPHDLFGVGSAVISLPSLT